VYLKVLVHGDIDLVVRLTSALDYDRHSVHPPQQWKAERAVLSLWNLVSLSNYTSLLSLASPLPPAHPSCLLPDTHLQNPLNYPDVVTPPAATRAVVDLSPQHPRYSYSPLYAASTAFRHRHPHPSPRFLPFPPPCCWRQGPSFQRKHAQSPTHSTSSTAFPPYLYSCVWS